MLAAVTGASGHVGGVLCRALLDAGYRVRILLHDDYRAIAGLDVDFVRGDVLQPDDVLRLTDGAEIVFHLAAVISIDGDPTGRVWETNVGGTQHVVQACMQQGVRRLVHFSSIHALDQFPLDRAIDEQRPYVGPSAFAYDRSKATGEQAVLRGVEEGLDAVILNPTSIIGPYDFKPSLMGNVFIRLYKRTLPALIEGGFDWVDVRDVVHAAMQSIERGEKGGKYLLSGAYASMREVARLASEVTGVRPPAFTTPLWLARVGVPFARMYSRMTSTTPVYTHESLTAVAHSNPHIRHDKAIGVLDFRPRPLQESITDVYTWFDKAGYLTL